MTCESEFVLTHVLRYAVSWVAAENPHGYKLAPEWIDSGRERVTVAGWGTFGSLVRICDDVHSDLEKIRQ